MDSAHIALFKLYLDPEMIGEDKECKKHFTAFGQGCVGFPVKSMATLLKGIKGSLLEVYATEDEITLTFSDDGGKEDVYIISSMYLDCEELEGSIANDSVRFTVDMDRWRECMKSLLLTGADRVNITKNATNKLSLTAKGAMVSGTSTIPVIDDMDQDKREIAPATLELNLGMLDTLTKLDGVAEFMEVSMASDNPIQGRVVLDCLGTFTVYLAPKVEEMTN